jgi:hypothetical protein
MQIAVLRFKIVSLSLNLPVHGKICEINVVYLCFRFLLCNQEIGVRKQLLAITERNDYRYSIVEWLYSYVFCCYKAMTHYKLDKQHYTFDSQIYTANSIKVVLPKP